MQFPNTSNGNANEGELKTKPGAGAPSFAPQSQFKQEIKAVNRNPEVENDVIECELKVANKIIEEAIRNEIRLSEVVRRIIALPVALACLFMVHLMSWAGRWN